MCKKPMNPRVGFRSWITAGFLVGGVVGFVLGVVLGVMGFIVLMAWINAAISLP